MHSENGPNNTAPTISSRAIVLENSPPKVKRLLQLDILRGFAIMLVLGFHMPLDARRAGVLTPLAIVWKRFGWTGVDLFFVLSGFLVGGLLFQEMLTRGGLDVIRFLVRRGFKIWPSYYLYLAYFMLMPSRRESGGIGPSVHASLPGVFHLQNYIGHIHNHTWSLAVEEHFYLILPLLLIFLLRGAKLQPGRMTWFPGIAVCFMIACTLLRIAANIHTVHPDLDQFFALTAQTHFRIDGLFCGVLLAWGYHFHRSNFEKWGQKRAALLTTGALLVSPMLFLDSATSVFIRTIGFTLLYAGYACLLMAVVCTQIDEGSFGRILGSRVARALGALGIYSYTVYLWHGDAWKVFDSVERHLWPIGNRLLGGHLTPSWNVMPESIRWLATVSIAVLLAIVVGIFFGRLAEKPMLTLRDKLYPARSAAMTPESQSLR